MPARLGHTALLAVFQRVWVQNASVDVADLLATNGVLHIINQVLQEEGVRRTLPGQANRQ